MGKWKTEFYVHKSKPLPKEKECKVCKNILPIEKFKKTYNKWHLKTCEDCFLIKNRERNKKGYEKVKDSVEFKEKRKKINQTHYYKDIQASREYSRNWFKTNTWKEYQKKTRIY
jgi:hypothetical protein